MRSLLTLAAMAALVSSAGAATQTVTLSVPGMNCAACPITVKKALNRVTGVSSIQVQLDRREAQVTFDDAKTSVAALRNATQEAGYPSTVVEAAK